MLDSQVLAVASRKTSGATWEDRQEQEQGSGLGRMGNGVSKKKTGVLFISHESKVWLQL